jgi:hypothetical protein
MCISLRWSITTYIIGLLGSFYLMTLKDKSCWYIGILFSYIIQMQLLEAIMWYNQDCKKNRINQIISKVSFFYILLQPFVANIVAYYITKNVGILIALIPFILLTIRHVYNFYPKEKDLCTQPGNNGHLNWKWLNVGVRTNDNGDQFYGFVWCLTILFPIFWMWGVGNPLTLLVTFLYLIMTFLYTFFKLWYEMKTGSSLWCILQFMTPYVAILVNYYK